MGGLSKAPGGRHVGARRRRRGRPGLSSLPLPPARFDLANVNTFETAEQAETEDRLRAKALRRRAKALQKRTKVNRKQVRRLLKLANRIDPDVTPHPNTPASSRYMRDQRRRILSAVWQLFHAPRA